ncbi:unnamed protein product [Euphydryas editha]|uniref:Gustatory receptor n=1 Tax=Euphydryas editha TaxID=104508 RepID=A0AAU9UIL4_EUPED|nr:unnamed protein product [Euphydryas editha]
MCCQIANKLIKRHYSTVKIIMSIRLLLGFYSKIHDSFKFAVVAKTYCVIYSTVLIYLLSNYWDVITGTVGNLNNLLKIATFIFTVILSLLTEGEYLFNYIQELDKVDPLALTSVENFQASFSIVTFIAGFSMTIYGCVRSIALQIYDIELVMLCFLLSLAVQISNMTVILMFETLWNRVKSLKKTMECWGTTHNVNDRQVKLHIKTLEEYMFIYRNILQSTKNISHASKFLMLLSLSSCFVNILYVADILSLMNMKWNVTGIAIIDAVLQFLPLCVPALFGELANAEVENIKINLARQFRICNNDALRSKILKAIKYIDMCPIKITVWRLFNVDFSMSLSFFNLCITYTIVLLQFQQVKI